MIDFFCSLLLALPAVLGTKIVTFMCRKKSGTSRLLRKYFSKKYNVEVDLYSYGGCFSATFNTGGKVKVGRYCSFAQNVSYFGANHPMNYISTSAYFYNKAFAGFDVKDVQRGTLSIGNDVWVGSGTIITAGCQSIGNGAVIGAGSVVTKDVPPYAVVAGVPAKIIRYRFSEEEIQALENSKWWLLNPQSVMEHYDSIDNVMEFCEKMREHK